MFWAAGCLSVSGEARFGAFLWYSQYAMPTTYAVAAIGIGDALFGEWPRAIYWTAALVIANGLAFYTAAKMVILIRKRREQPRAPRVSQ